MDARRKDQYKRAYHKERDAAYATSRQLDRYADGYLQERYRRQSKNREAFRSLRDSHARGYHHGYNDAERDYREVRRIQDRHQEVQRLQDQRRYQDDAPRASGAGFDYGRQRYGANKPRPGEAASSTHSISSCHEKAS